jgi:hypothetical protein
LRKNLKIVVTKKPQIGEYYQNEDVVAAITGWDEDRKNIVFYRYKTKNGWSLECSWDWTIRPARKLTPLEIELL